MEHLMKVAKESLSKWSSWLPENMVDKDIVEDDVKVGPAPLGALL